MLDAAVSLMAQKGVDISVREITEKAGTNIAAVNYYYGSKEALIREAFTFFSQPINRARHLALSRCEQLLETEKISVRDIVSSFVQPYISGSGDLNSGHPLARIALISRNMPNELAQSLIEEHFNPTASKVIDLLSKVLPHIPRRILYLRYYIMTGTVLAALIGNEEGGRLEQLSRLSEGEFTLKGKDELNDQLINFITVGFMAPV